MLHDLSRQLRRLLDEATRPNAGHRHAPRQAPEPNVIRFRYDPAATLRRTAQDWRQRLLIKRGARMHATSVERGDGCSIAILDASGVVVTWHDSLPGSGAFDFRVVGAHVSQFYLPQDVAFQGPDRRLSAACLHGSDTQQGWHRRPNGSIFWGVTVVEAIRLNSGELYGYSHVTRYSKDPHERVLADVRRKPRNYSPCFAGLAVA